MKIKKLFLSVLINVLFFSCNINADINENIETAFKQHVQGNFDNPKDLIEILSISIEDTISSKKVICFANKILHESDSTRKSLTKQIDSLHKINNDRFEFIKKSSKLSQKYRTDNNTISVLMNTFNTRAQEVEYAQSKDYKLFEYSRAKCDTLINAIKNDSINVFIYEIMTRCFINNEPKIKRFYAHITAPNNIQILDNNSITNYSEISNLYDELETYMTLYGKLLKIRLSVLEAEQKQYEHFK